MNIFTSIEYIHIAMCFVYGRLVKSVFPMIVFRLEDVILDVLWYVYIWTYNCYVVNYLITLCACSAKGSSDWFVCLSRQHEKHQLCRSRHLNDS